MNELDKLSFKLTDRLFEFAGSVPDFTPAALAGVMGVAAFDQHLAAVAEAEREALNPSGQYETPAWVEGDASRELIYLTVAGIVRAQMGGHVCEHFHTGQRAITVMLGPRVATCAECGPSFYEVIEAHDRLVMEGGDTLCDFCLAESAMFVPARLSFGPCIVMGDLCDACSTRMGNPPPE